MASHQGGANFDFSTMDFSGFPMSQTVFSGLKGCEEGNTSSNFYFGDEGVDTSFGQQSFDSIFPPSMDSTDFGLEQPLSMDNTSGSASWNNVPTSTLNSFPPTPAQSFDPLYTPQFSGNYALGKRPLQLDVHDFPPPKRHESVAGAELAFSPFPASASVTGSSWTVESQSTPSSSTEMGLSDEAADVCATWFSKYNVLPSDRHIDSLSQLTCQSPAAIRHWFGQALKTGLGGHDSAYKSQTGAFTQESILHQLPGSAPETVEQPMISDLSCFHDAQASMATAQPVLRGGKKGCNPTDDPELLKRDPNKVFQCTRKCGKRYGRKCDWKRNEEEGYPSKSWICSLCVNQGIERVKPCFRKYHFSQHFRNVHPGIDCTDFEETSTVRSDTEFPKRCGFCPHRFASRQDRIDHLANHFQRGKCMLDWNNEDNNDSDNVDDDDDADDNDGRPDSGGFDSSKPYSPRDYDQGSGPEPNNSPDGGTDPDGQHLLHGGFFQFHLSGSDGSDARSPSCVKQHIKPTCVTGDTCSIHQQYDASEGDDSNAVAGDAISQPLSSTTIEARVVAKQAQQTEELDVPTERLEVANTLSLTAPSRGSDTPKLTSLDVGDVQSMATLYLLATLMIASTREDKHSEGDKFERSPASNIGSNTEGLVGAVLGTKIGSFNLHIQDVLKTYKTLCSGTLIPQLSPLLPPPLPPSDDDDLPSCEVQLAQFAERYVRGQDSAMILSSDFNKSEDLSVLEHLNPKFSRASKSTWLASMLSLSLESVPDQDPLRLFLRHHAQIPGMPGESMTAGPEVNPLVLAALHSISPRSSSRGNSPIGAVLSNSKKLLSQEFGHCGGLTIRHSVDSRGHYKQQRWNQDLQSQSLTQMEQYWKGITTLTDSQAFLSVRLLGTGGFSTVDEVFHRETHLRICRKTLKNREHSALGELKKEVEVLQKLRHPHVIRFLGAYSKGDKMSILLSPVAETTLAVWLDMSMIEKPAGLPETIVKMLGCLSSTIRYLHEQRPVVKHMDIKPQNILVVQGSQEFPHVVLSDFGISSFDQATSQDKSRALTRHYCAPEVSDGTSREQAADIWSLGCVFAEMASAAYSIDNPHWLEFRQEYRGRDGKYYCQDTSHLHAGLSHLMQEASSMMETTVLTTVKSMLNPKPDQRPDAAMLTMVFAPAPCCLSWPNNKASFPGPNEELQAVKMLVHEAGVDCRAQLHRQGDKSEKHEVKPLAQGKKWLKECIDHHEACRQQLATEKVLPTRLIDIRPENMEGIAVRLVDSAQLKSRAGQIDYVAVSHVWSQSDLTLSTDRSLEMQSKLSREMLPKAINEAISAIEQTGYRYLWVDSLCVLQDSEEDKRRECLTINNTYRNAALTIVLDRINTTSVSTSTGNHDHGTDVKSSVGEVWISPGGTTDENPVLATHPAINYLIPGFAWDTRAWSLQDRLLSRRLLILGPQQMYWECNALKASETFPSGLPPLLWERVHTKTDRSPHERQGHPATGTKLALADPRGKQNTDMSSPRLLKTCQWIKKEGDGIGDSMEAATMQLIVGNTAIDDVKSKIYDNDQTGHTPFSHGKSQTRTPRSGRTYQRLRPLQFKHRYTPGYDTWGLPSLSLTACTTSETMWNLSRGVAQPHVVDRTGTSFVDMDTNSPVIKTDADKTNNQIDSTATFVPKHADYKAPPAADSASRSDKRAPLSLRTADNHVEQARLRHKQRKDNRLGKKYVDDGSVKEMMDMDVDVDA